MRDLIYRIAQKWKNLKQPKGGAKNTEQSKLVKFEIKDILQHLLDEKKVHSEGFTVSCGAYVGQNFYKRPIISIRNKDENPVELHILFSEQFTSVIIGLTQKFQDTNNSGTPDKNAQHNRNVIEQYYKTKEIDIQKADTILFYTWKTGNIYHWPFLFQEYNVENLPEDNTLINDLKRMLDEYIDFYRSIDYSKFYSIHTDTNYWVFQGNPANFDFKTAFKDKNKHTWTVSAHKDKIKPGDKVIIWLTGKEAGCYALAEVTANPQQMKNTEDQKYWQTEPNSDLKAGINITHNLINNPIYQKQIDHVPELKKLKAGNQGTNFKATGQEFKVIKSIIEKRKGNNIMSEDKEEFPLKSLNTILYGPPGTGKTYYIQKELIPLFTDSQTSSQIPEDLISLVEDFTMWQCIGTVLYMAEGPVALNDIYSHPIMQMKQVLSTAKLFDASIRGVLQTHTIDDCKYVKIKERAKPQIFFKDNNSKWSIIKEDLDEVAPQIISFAEMFNVSNRKEKRYSFITFHQSYSYEDFIEGIRPILDETDNEKLLQYQIHKGSFLKISEEAKLTPEKNFAIFVDEINRGNISKVFGELITLIENDKRQSKENEIKVKLPYSGKEFSVPANLYIVGTMNTADRSLAQIDTALRRRFHFIEMMPQPELLDHKTVNGVQIGPLLRTINNRIEALYDRDHTIGHSYFMSLEPDSDISELSDIFQNKVIPLLEEYFFEDWDKIRLVLNDPNKNQEFQFIQVAENSSDLFGTESDIPLRTRYTKNPDALSDPQAYIQIYET